MITFKHKIKTVLSNRLNPGKMEPSKNKSIPDLNLDGFESESNIFKSFMDTFPVILCSFDQND